MLLIAACVPQALRCAQVYSTNLGQVVDIVVSHQGLAIKTQLVSQLMSTLVLPAPEHYRPLLRRLAALGGALASHPWIYLWFFFLPVLPCNAVKTHHASTREHNMECGCFSPAVPTSGQPISPKNLGVLEWCLFALCRQRLR